MMKSNHNMTNQTQWKKKLFGILENKELKRLNKKKIFLFI